MLGYPVRMTGRDSWSGPEDNGYYVFNSDAARKAYINDQMKDRRGAAPEYYVEYTSEQPFELLPESVNKFDEDGKFFAEKISKTVKINLV